MRRNLQSVLFAQEESKAVVMQMGTQLQLWQYCADPSFLVTAWHLGPALPRDSALHVGPAHGARGCSPASVPR